MLTLGGGGSEKFQGESRACKVKNHWTKGSQGDKSVRTDVTQNWLLHEMPNTTYEFSTWKPYELDFLKSQANLNIHHSEQ